MTGEKKLGVASHDSEPKTNRSQQPAAENRSPLALPQRWNGFVVQRQDAIAVERGTGGEIVIRQERWPDDDVEIAVEAIHAPALADAILAAARAPLTNAERQRRYRARRNEAVASDVTAHNDDDPPLPFGDAGP